ncbi:MAG: carboxypeptidase-like regulatory domain-containing protein [Oscillospiraceae bacterium]|nr:carboxypeptidase-like regulatory domain-containing protein [Oscillospiraceae bacterium]
MGTGYLTVKVGMANEAAPIEGANVVIKQMDGQTLFTLRTDASGRTETVPLYAPDKSLTLNPDYNTRGRFYHAAKIGRYWLK